MITKAGTNITLKLKAVRFCDMHASSELYTQFRESSVIEIMKNLVHVSRKTAVIPHVGHHPTDTMHMNARSRCARHARNAEEAGKTAKENQTALEEAESGRTHRERRRKKRLRSREYKKSHHPDNTCMRVLARYRETRQRER